MNVCEKGMAGIYSIRNAVSGDSYIGSSVDVRRRLFAHRSSLRRGVHENKHLQAAWNKYGEAAFVFSLVASCRHEDVVAVEQTYLDKYVGAYNMCRVADRPPSRKGQRNTDEHRKRCSAANIGKRQNRTPAWNENIRRSLMGKHWKLKSKRQFHHLSEQHKAAISAGNKGKNRSPEARANDRIAARLRVERRRQMEAQ